MESCPVADLDDIFTAVKQRLTTHAGPINNADTLSRPCGHRTALDESHCTDCHRTWSAHTQAHCVACCCHFSSASAFDVHQRQRNHSNGRTAVICTDPETITKKDSTPRLVRVEDQYGAMWALPGTWEGPKS
jgi:hypothetical protein